jgi:hypothetical protein
MKNYSSKVNFIKHFLEVNNLFQEDSKITPFHISLYNALFLEWNHANFKNPISISRNEMMRISKIGSTNTYLKALKELHELKYIEYLPSFNRYVGSKVTMFIFDNGSDTACNTGCDIGTNTASEQQVRPYLNYNKLNKEKQTIQTNKTIDEQAKNKKNRGLSLFEEENKNESQNVQDFKPKKSIHSFPSTLQEVQVYFSEKKFPAIEAEKFFNHFESNGWLVGGRSKMRNWKAAANNWLLNSPKYKKANEIGKPNHYQAEENKEFDIPL